MLSAEVVNAMPDLKTTHRICDLNCDHKITKIPKGDPDNPYKTDLYVCSECLKEFRKV